jgi:disulfide bond formation protein DsbB
MDAVKGFALRQWPLLALLISAAMLAIAHGFEQFGGLAPCVLCLRQREVYWVALAIAAVGFLLQRVNVRASFVRAVCIALAICFLVGVGIAAYHAGAEWKWWPGPQACASTGGRASAAAMGDLLAGARMTMPHCDEAAWVFLGLSMAGWNAVISLLLAIMSLAAARRPWTAPPAPITV